MMMKKKKNLFFSLAAAMAATGLAFAANKAVAKNGGVKPTFGKARNGVTTMIGKAKSSPAASAITGTLASWRDLFVANDFGALDAPHSTEVIAPTAAESSLMQTDEPEDKPRQAA